MLSEPTPEQRALAEYMSELSEEAYCASWMSGLEYALWEAVVRRRHAFGRLPFGTVEVERLRNLARECGDWIVFVRSPRPLIVVVRRTGRLEAPRFSRLPSRVSRCMVNVWRA